MTRCRTVNDYSALRGPAPDGFHVPLTTERQAVRDIRTALGGGSSDGTNFGITLKLPSAGLRHLSSAGVSEQGSYGYYWSSSRCDDNRAYFLNLGWGTLSPQEALSRAFGFSVRCFKNSPTIPTSSWTKLYGTSIESGGIFWSSTDGLISLSSDGQTWITIMDKNLGATTVWSNGDALSEANCGTYFQWGNNYGFPYTGSVTTSSTQVDASNYGPGNYYNSGTFITRSSSPYRWDTTDNANLWGGETGIVERQVCEKFTLHGAIQTFHRKRPYEWKPGANTIAYYPLNGDANDYSGNNRNLTTNNMIYTSGGPGQVAVFTSFGNYAYYQDNSLFDLRSPFTYNVRANASSITSGYYNGSHPYWNTLISIQDGTTIASHCEDLGFGLGNKVIGYQGNVDYMDGGTISTNHRYNIVFTYDGNGGKKLYIDGVQVASDTITPTSVSYSNARLVLSRSATSYNAQPYDGMLSNVIVENKVRTSEDITNYYNRSKSNYGL